MFSKGTDPDREAYSAFDGTGLADWLRDQGVRRLAVAGLATDYCVRASVLDDGPIYQHVRRECIESLLNSERELPNSQSKFLFYFLNSKLFLEEFAP